MASSFPNSNQLFDAVRGHHVTATAEERVRQHILNKLINNLGFTKELIAVEKTLQELPELSGVTVPNRRVDILCYGKNIHPSYPLYPLLLIECKQGVIDRQAIAQLCGYNAYVKAYFIALVNTEEERLGFLDRKKEQYVFYAGLRSYQDLIACLPQ